jgi:hypothetical protein
MAFKDVIQRAAFFVAISDVGEVYYCRVMELAIVAKVKAMDLLFAPATAIGATTLIDPNNLHNAGHGFA